VKEGRNWLVKLMFSARGPAATKNNNQKTRGNTDKIGQLLSGGALLYLNNATFA